MHPAAAKGQHAAGPQTCISDCRGEGLNYPHVTPSVIVGHTYEHS